MTDKTKMVLVGQICYSADEWAAAFNECFLAMMETSVHAVRTDRQLLRAVRGMRDKNAARKCVVMTIERITRLGHPQVLDQETMEISARFPGLSDPPARVGVDQRAEIK